MRSTVLESKAIPYWNYVKDASLDIKFALISLLNDSIRKAVRPKSKATKPSKRPASVEIRAQKEKEFLASFSSEKEDDAVDVSWVHEIVKDVPKMDEDVDYDEIWHEHLIEKYG